MKWKIAAMLVLGIGIQSAVAAPGGGRGGSGLKFGILGLSNSTSYIEKTSTESATSAAMATTGFGLQIGYSGSGSWGWDLGLLQVSRKFGEAGTEVTMNFIEVPVMARYTFFQYFNLGFGLYYASTQGEVDIAGTKSTYEALQLESSDLGAVVALGAKIPLGGIRILLEGRQGMGQRDFSKVRGLDGRFNSTQLVLGVEL